MLVRSSASLLLVFALTTVVAGALAWQQYQRAERLEAQLAVVAAIPRENAVVRPAALPAELPSSAQTPAPTASELASDPTGRGPDDEPLRSGRGDGAGRFQALMEDPAFAAAWQAQQKSRLDERYATLFRQLNLSPAQIDQLKTMLADRQAARMDVMAAARSEGVADRDDIRQLMQQTRAEIDEGIEQLLGPVAYAQYQQYERTTAERSVATQLETRVSYSGAPLTGAQRDALVTILAETSGNANRSAMGEVNQPPGAGGATTTTFAGGGALITDDAIARAQGVLSPAQLEALRELQAEQLAQQQIQEQLRRQFRRDRPTRPTGG